MHSSNSQHRQLLTSRFFLLLCCSVGMLFLPNDDALEAQAKAIIDEVVAGEGLKVLGYRQVPVAHEVVGRFAKATQPRIWQVGLDGPGAGGIDQGGVACRRGLWGRMLAEAASRQTEGNMQQAGCRWLLGLDQFCGKTLEAVSVRK